MIRNARKISLASLALAVTLVVSANLVCAEGEPSTAAPAAAALPAPDLAPPAPQDDGRKAACTVGFADTEKKNDLLIPKNWELKTKLGTAAAVFCVKSADGTNVLNMSAVKATGTYLYSLPDTVDLKKTPVIRWCWRVKKLPTGGDGRDSAKDDQAIGVYVGTGTFSQDSVAYRWETETPKGQEGKVKYGGGLVAVKWYAARNKEDCLNTWCVEERNVAEDFKKSYGYVPKKFALSVVCNSQYTESEAEAELAWLQFLPEK